MHGCHRLGALLVLPLLLLLPGCGDDENELTQSNYFTGLWRMETPGPVVEVLYVEMEQDKGAIEGNFYFEEFQDLGEEIPLLDGSVSGGKASFDMDISAVPADNLLRTIITMDTLRCSVVIAIAEGGDTSAVEGKVAPAPADGPRSPYDLAMAYARTAGARPKDAEDEPIRINRDDPSCPLDTIWIGVDSVYFEPVQFTATGGNPPYIWYAYGLPFGLSLDPETGLVSGTPLEIVGDYTFYIVAISLEDVETIHLDATIDNPNLLQTTMERCAPGICVKDRIPAERKIPGF